MQDSNGFEFVVEFGSVTGDRSIHVLRVIFNPLVYLSSKMYSGSAPVYDERDNTEFALLGYCK